MPGSPSATVVMLRRTGEMLEWLVLADSVLVLDVAGSPEPVVVCDDREAQVGARYRTRMDALPGGSPEHQQAHAQYVEAMRRHRNRDDGFWVASVDPLAAEQAQTGAMPAGEVRAAAYSAMELLAWSTGSGWPRGGSCWICPTSPVLVS
ncbi:hypothetical protein AB0M95_13675 [Sphaerisporangium sp. NPDC051017]|uniref:hypothetical protein n=1 Tax=Sphaerisporangium sp. NPDC051017 TaxID=3154636 RepID=UPI003414344B